MVLSLTAKITAGVCSLFVIAAVSVGIYFGVRPDHSDNVAKPGSSSSSTGTLAPGESAPAPIVPGRSTDTPLKNATDLGACTADNCKLPDCFCANTLIPGGLDRSVTPQFIMVTFDDYLNDAQWVDSIKDLIFKTTARDATGCWPRLTFYLQNDLTDYTLVDIVKAMGSEAACHTIDHVNPTDFSVNQWYKTVAGTRDFMTKQTSVPKESFLGSRAPWLIYSDNMFEALYRAGYLYDSSVVERHDSLREHNSKVDLTTHVGQWLWPYTLDHGLQQICPWGNKCPVKAYPGLWEVPMDVNLDFTTMFGSEMDPAYDGDALLNLFKTNFDSRYLGNRAPMGIFLHGNWLLSSKSRVGILEQFYDYAASHPGVVFATPQQIIQWMRDPKPIDQIGQLNFLKCPSALNDTPCGGQPVNTCTFDQGVYKTCKACPSAYPSVATTTVADLP